MEKANNWRTVGIAPVAMAFLLLSTHQCAAAGNDPTALCLQSTASPTHAAARSNVNIRSTDKIVLAAIADGSVRSPTFAELVDRLETSELLIYVSRVYGLPHRMEGCVIPGQPGGPYVRILLAMNNYAERIIPVLAHELQHVREIVDAGMGHDQAAFDAVFSRIGARQRGSDTAEQFETATAITVMRTVERELRDHATGVPSPRCNRDSSGFVRMTDGYAIDSDPAWSPDGTRIVFSTNRFDRYIPVLPIMNAEGRGAAKIGSGFTWWAPAWSPDRSLIAFSREIPGDPYDSYAIYTVKADGSDDTFILGQGSLAAEPLVGLWRLQRQEIDGNATDFEPPLALQISQTRDRLRFAFSVPRPDIYVVTITYTLRLDGSEADILDGTNQKVGTIQMTRSGPGQYLLTMKGPNRPDAQGKLTISADGKTLISESDATQSGHSVHSKQIFARH